MQIPNRHADPCRHLSLFWQDCPGSAVAGKHRPETMLWPSGHRQSPSSQKLPESQAWPFEQCPVIFQNKNRSRFRITYHQEQFCISLVAHNFHRYKSRRDPCIRHPRHTDPKLSIDCWCSWKLPSQPHRCHSKKHHKIGSVNSMKGYHKFRARIALTSLFHTGPSSSAVRICGALFIRSSRQKLASFRESALASAFDAKGAIDADRLSIEYVARAVKGNLFGDWRLASPVTLFPASQAIALTVNADAVPFAAGCSSRPTSHEIVSLSSNSLDVTRSCRFIVVVFSHEFSSTNQPPQDTLPLDANVRFSTCGITGNMSQFALFEWWWGRVSGWSNRWVWNDEMIRTRQTPFRFTAHPCGWWGWTGEVLWLISCNVHSFAWIPYHLHKRSPPLSFPLHTRKFCRCKTCSRRWRGIAHPTCILPVQGISLEMIAQIKWNWRIYERWSERWDWYSC